MFFGDSIIKKPQGFHVLSPQEVSEFAMSSKSFDNIGSVHSLALERGRHLHSFPASSPSPSFHAKAVKDLMSPTMTPASHSDILPLDLSS